LAETQHLRLPRLFREACVAAPFGKMEHKEIFLCQDSGFANKFLAAYDPLDILAYTVF